MFDATVIDKTAAGQFATVTRIEEAQLSEGDITIEIELAGKVRGRIFAAAIY